MSGNKSGKVNPSAKSNRASKELSNHGIKDANHRNTKSKQVSYDQPAAYLMLPVLFILCILPFVIRLKEYKSHLTQYQWFSAEINSSDFFLYWKHFLFIVAAVVMVSILVNNIIKDRKSFKIPKIYIPLGIYALFAFLSSIFSKSLSFSFGGSFEQFESIFVILGYCIAVIYVYYFIHAEKDYQLIFKSITVVALIQSVIGVLQFIGLDYFKASVVRNLTIPAKYTGVELTANFAKGTVFTTLYNPNYVGVYAALIVPVLIVMLFFFKEFLWKLLSGVAAIGLIVCAIGARSLAGVMGIGAAIILIIIFMWRHLIKHYYVSISIVIVLIIGVIATNVAMNNYFGNKLINLMNNSKSNFDVTQIETNNDNVSLTYRGNLLKLQYVKNEDNSISFIPMDADNNMIPCTFDESTGAYQADDTRFTGIVFGLGDEEGKTFCIQAAGHTWFFTNQTGDGQYYYVNAYGKPDKIVKAPSALFTGYEGIASGRGYIWSRTIPLLKNDILIGTGPNTFLLYFPQQDYLYRSLMGFDTAIMTKPHSLYLQIAAQTGILSLIAFLVFYGMYFVSSIRLYIRGRFNSYFAKAGLAVFIGSFAYMVTGLTNDSCIAVAPTFWVLMGLGIALNAKAKPMIQQEIEDYKETKRNKHSS